MLMHNEHPPDATYVPVTYQFLEPVRLRIQRPDGRVELIGYGIGETIDVMEPGVQYCIPPTRRLVSIPLADGSHIIDPPLSIDARRI
jgi:hypothetical protein